MKHNKGLPTPKGAQRITKPDKTRVWIFGDLEFKSKRELFEYFSPEARIERAKSAEKELQEVVVIDKSMEPTA